MNKIFLGIIAMLIILDIVKSYSQHLDKALDGDIPESVLPLDSIKPVFADPFGIKTMVNHDKHMGPNRFFSHWFENRWFNSVPFAFQKICDPIHSVYNSAALFKTIVQILLIYLLAVFTFGEFNIFKTTENLLVILAYSSLFMGCGNGRGMAIIDPAVTYSFFYAMPLLFLLLYLLPFIFKEFYNKKVLKNKVFAIIWSIIFLLLSNFSGPVNPGAELVFIVIIVLRYILNFYKDNNKEFSIKKIFTNIPKHYYFYLLPMFFIALYSLYLGTFNIMNEHTVSLSERFLLLPKGFIKQYFGNFGFSFLFYGCIINTILIIIFSDKKTKKVTNIFYFMLLFSLLYIVLLPFGGYRPYRPYIIRYDTIIFITLAYMFYVVYSTYILITKILKTDKTLNIYSIFSVVFFTYFFVIDNSEVWTNRWEKDVMYRIANSDEKVITYDDHVTVVSWYEIAKPEDSEPSVRCMRLWKILDKDVRFYCPNPRKE